MYCWGTAVMNGKKRPFACHLLCGHGRYIIGHGPHVIHGAWSEAGR
ncbi:MAG: hypothetical protein GY803_13355 [Chloroflexi bacterium]|nr:hypothetical protein [Chloroflexota bacterium]